MNFLKTAGIAAFSALWVVGIMGVVNRCLLVGIWERQPNEQMLPQAARYLESARMDLAIGCVWLMAVIVFWSCYTRRTILDLQRRVADLEARQSGEEGGSPAPSKN